MATYKVIQDIEAEDKLIGPLGLRQLIYFLIAAFLGWISFLLASKGASFLLVATIPPMLFCLFFAWPWSSEQPTEVWALAHIRFYLKSRIRVWDQSGVKELVTITAPKKIERIQTNSLTQTEVKSRLRALANTIDSRGWAVKTAGITNMPPLVHENSDRLVTMASMPAPVMDLDVRAADDILDEHNNRISQQISQMVDASEVARRQQIEQQLRTPTTPPLPPGQQPPAPDYWFMQETPQEAAARYGAATPGVAPQVVAPGAGQPYGPVAAAPTPEEEALANTLAAQASADSSRKNAHLKVIDPLKEGEPTTLAAQRAAEEARLASEQAQRQAAFEAQNMVASVPEPIDPVNMELATKDGLSVASLAREAHRAHHKDDAPEDGVVEVPLR